MKRSWIARIGLVTVLGSSSAACGTQAEFVTAPDAGASLDGLTLVTGAPDAPSAEPASEAHILQGYATSATSVGSVVTIGTTTGIYAATGGTIELLPLVGDDPNLPPSTGTVRALAPFMGGSLAFADQGVFFATGAAIQLSKATATLAPLGITSATTRVVDANADAAAATVRLAMTGEKGAYELDDQNLVTWTVDGESGAPTAVVAQDEGLVLAYGPRVYAIDRSTMKARFLSDELGHIRAMACETLACGPDSTLFFATDRGLAVRSAQGALTLHTLAAEGTAPVPVDGFALDATRQRLYAITEVAVLRIGASVSPVSVATSNTGGASRHAAVDESGNVWIGQGASATRLALGTPLGFATDVKPVLHTYCAPCHAIGASGAPKQDLEDYDVFVGLLDVALTRITSHTMPPSTYDKKLSKETIQLIVDWSSSLAK